MFDGVDEVFGQGVELVEESIRVISITEVSYSVVDRVFVYMGSRGRSEKIFMAELSVSAILISVSSTWVARGSSTVLRVEVSAEFEVGIFKAEGD